MTRSAYRYCKVQKKVVPAHEVIREVHANIAHGYIPDEMPPTRSPITGLMYTSKAALRAEYKAHGCEEVGTAYERGYDPERKHREAERELVGRTREVFKEILNNGAGRNR